MPPAILTTLTQQETKIGMLLGFSFIALLALIIFIGIRASVKSKQRRQQYLLEKGAKTMTTLIHVEGLPLGEGSQCNLFLSEDKLSIENGGSQFSVRFDQITAVDFKMDVEIAHIVTSSAAKGVVGGIVFGPIGAVIGSRANSKEKRTVTGYMIINYINSKGELSPLLFTDGPSSRAAKFVDQIRPMVVNGPKYSYEL